VTASTVTEPQAARADATVPALVIKDVSSSSGDHRAPQRHVEVRRGEVHGVIGKNGAGKSTR
jgi:ABC-type sugar transport system ATPase subunit